MLTALPDRVIASCTRVTDDVDNIPCANILDVAFLHVSPGGMTEAAALVQYVRNPGNARNGREAKDMMNEWIVARKRLAVVNMPDLAPMEQVNAMVGIIKNVLATDQVLDHRFANLRYSTTARSPTLDDAKRIELFLLTELNVIESNEMVEEGMKESSWHLQTVPGQINAVQGDRETSLAPESGGAGSKVIQKRLCYQFAQGKCKFGSKCRFSHDEQREREKGEGAGYSSVCILFYCKGVLER